MNRRPDENGVVLINVLVVLALMASVVVAMTSISDISITRSQRFSEAAQALALIAAAETSAIATLRRDMTENPLADDLTEPWAAIGQDQIAIENGRFALQIEDAQGLLNLNSLPGSGALGAQMLQRVLAAQDLPPQIGLQILARLAQPEPLESLDDLITQAGLDRAEVLLLGGLVTVLPGRTDINLNTAPEPLLAALTDNPVQARTLIGLRNRNGRLTSADIAAARLILPPGAGFASRYFRVTSHVTVGSTLQQQSSLLQRRTGRGGLAEVEVITRNQISAARPDSMAIAISGPTP